MFGSCQKWGFELAACERSQKIYCRYKLHKVCERLEFQVAQWNQWWWIENWSSTFFLIFPQDWVSTNKFPETNCSDLLWEEIVLGIEKTFWNSRLKAENLQNFWNHWSEFHAPLDKSLINYQNFLIPISIDISIKTLVCMH